MFRQFTIVPALLGIFAMIISACSAGGGSGDSNNQEEQVDAIINSIENKDNFEYVKTIEDESQCFTSNNKRVSECNEDLHTSNTNSNNKFMVTENMKGIWKYDRFPEKEMDTEQYYFRIFSDNDIDIYHFYQPEFDSDNLCKAGKVELKLNESGEIIIDSIDDESTWYPDKSLGKSTHGISPIFGTNTEDENGIINDKMLFSGNDLYITSDITRKTVKLEKGANIPEVCDTAWEKLPPFKYSDGFRSLSDPPTTFPRDKTGVYKRHYSFVGSYDYMYILGQYIDITTDRIIISETALTKIGNSYTNSCYYNEFKNFKFIEKLLSSNERIDTYQLYDEKIYMSPLIQAGNYQIRRYNNNGILVSDFIYRLEESSNFIFYESEVGESISITRLDEYGQEIISDVQYFYVTASDLSENKRGFELHSVQFKNGSIQINTPEEHKLYNWIAYDIGEDSLIETHYNAIEAIKNEDFRLASSLPNDCDSHDDNNLYQY